MDATTIFFIIVGLLIMGCIWLYKDFRDIKKDQHSEKNWYKFAGSQFKDIGSRLEKLEAKRKAKRTNKKEGKNV